MRIDTIYTNAHFRTLDVNRPTATRLGVLGGRIVGFDEELEGIEADDIVDLGGAPALPGFHDAHHHISLTGARLAALDLRPSKVGSLEALYDAVAHHAATLGPDEWVRGSGYDQNALGGEHPTADALDRAAAGRPVLLEHVSAHMLVANTRALELAGFPDRRGLPAVTGGWIPVDDDGRAVGLLQEAAVEIVYRLVRPLGLEEVQRNLELASKHAVRYGITSATEPGIGDHAMMGNSPVDLHSYQQAVAEGRLKIRATLMPYCTTLHDVEGFRDKDWFGLDLGIRTGFGDDRLRLGPVKILSDGSFIGRSAAMHTCYHGEPDNYGLMTFEDQHLEDMITGAHQAGWTVATHAIGDAAIDQVMNAFEKAQRLAPRPGARHRIEHFAFASAAQVARAARLGIVPVPQGVFISDFGDGMREAVADQDPDRIYRMKSLLEAGMVLPGSSDSPVSDANPLTCIRDMVNRRTASGDVLAPAERLTVGEAVRAYTWGSAYAEGSEHSKGRLARGMLADFVTLDRDLFEIDPATVGDAAVARTVIGGETVFDAEHDA
ncbi:amidohydrolase [Zhihengliuella halotolerans]|uniref:amidohydrolase n=1 Tax=Zhihengliuella halotolerans TaxID=370736 RepID=UPI000C8013D7|nr:amidohydrolase [Zhihengliuella halotolerans]